MLFGKSYKAGGATSVVELKRDVYQAALRRVGEWCLRSERPTGGSAAYQLPILGWSKSYPETTGYLIPTLLNIATFTGDNRYREAAERHGHWLLSIQSPEGWWAGGLHPNRSRAPSIFNTGQILKGMNALAAESGCEEWDAAAHRAQAWLLSNMQSEGLWPGGDYRASRTPSYYSEVLWPMAARAIETNDGQAAERIRGSLQRIVERRTTEGAFRFWGFDESGFGFTHTIAYTIRGLQEGGLLLDDESIYRAPEAALEKMLRVSELRGGRLPGGFQESWMPDTSFMCLTGNAQTALCLLRMESTQSDDLRVVSGAARMLDAVVDRLPVSGAIAGSRPVWGPYIRGRYPNWAAKYVCDALIELDSRLAREVNEWRSSS